MIGVLAKPRYDHLNVWASDDSGDAGLIGALHVSDVVTVVGIGQYIEFDKSTGLQWVRVLTSFGVGYVAVTSIELLQ